MLHDPDRLAYYSCMTHGPDGLALALAGRCEPHIYRLVLILHVHAPISFPLVILSP